MQISLLLMEEIAKLFAIMLMGYAVVKAGLMKSSESKSISVVMVYLVIPCVIIDAFQVDYTPDVKKGLLLACAAAVLVHVLFLILTTILKQVLRLVICPLSSRQVKYLKVSDKNTYISFWGVGIFMHTISLYIF